MMPAFSYTRVTSVDEAVRRLAEGDALPHSGGTDLLGCLREHILTPGLVVSLSGLDELRGIAATGDGGLRIGALTTISDIAANPDVVERYTALADAAAVVASPQLRNRGTLGGNLCQKPRCWYYRGEFDCLRKGGDLCYAVEGQNQFHCIFGGDGCYIVHPSDPAPALAALDAVVEIAGPGGRRAVPVADFHVPPSVDIQRETVLDDGEIVVAVVLPPPPAGLRSSYRKVRARASWDFALAGAALALAFDGDVVRRARVVLSGVAPVPWRSEPVEKALTGRRLDEAAIEAAAKAAVEGAEPMSRNVYKVPLLEGLMRERLTRLRG